MSNEYVSSNMIMQNFGLHEEIECLIKLMKMYANLLVMDSGHEIIAYATN